MMKRNQWRWLLVALCLGWTASASAGEGVSDSHLELGGKFGVGTDSIFLSQGSPNIFNSSGYSYNSVDFTYWLSGSSALQLLGFANLYSYPGYDFTGAAVNNPSQAWGTGIGYKYNAKEPFKGLFVQLLGRVTYAQETDDQIQSTAENKDFYETFGFFGGIGFEYFLPFLPALSLGANVGYLFGYDDGWTLDHENPSYSSAKDKYQPYHYWQGGVVSNGFTLNTLTINFYF